MALRDRILGEPERLDPAGLERVLGYASPSARIRATLQLARLGRTARLLSLLTDPVPGVRRAAARGLGWAAAGEPQLQARLRVEPCDTVRVALAGALLRCGAPPTEVVGWLRALAARSLGTWYGPRRPSAVTASGPTELEQAVWIEVGRTSPGRPRHREEVLADGELALRERDGPAAAEGLWILAAHAPVDLPEQLPTLERTSGRRSEHAILEALGWLGDPRVVPRLVEALRAMDVDPGRGFKHRRLAAVALGRIGDPTLRGEIVAALTREALEFEGRPGAGLGVQFPVRTLLLWALGEVGDPAAASTLVGYLDNTHGSATGGLHLPAMAALVKLGPAAIPEIEPLLRGAEVLAANAAGVLAALPASATLTRAQQDARERVRAAAGAVPQDPAREVATLAAPESDIEVLHGIALLMEGEFFEAHEVLEIPWRRSADERRLYLQALIQGAVAYEHLRRGNPRGALGQWTKARAKLLRLPAWFAGVGLGPWREAVDAFVEHIALEARSASYLAKDGRAFPPLPDETSWPRPPLDARLRLPEPAPS